MISKKTRNSAARNHHLAHRSHILAYLLCAATLILLSGCGYQCCPGPKGCFGMDAGRRPQVMATKSSRIIDYNACCEGREGFDEDWVGVDSPLQDSVIEKDDETSEEGPSKDTLPHTPEEKKEDDKQYRFNVGDLLDISILGEEETLVESAIIAPDGNLYYAFLNGIPAEGRTIQEVSKDITDKISNIFVNPIVTISPTRATENTFKIFGRVYFPGVYPMQGPVYLREAFGMAGGLLTESYKDKDVDSDLYDLANLRESFLIRDGKKIDVDFETLLYDPANQQDILLKAGDYIYVAPSQIEDVYVLGAVRGPQRVIYTRGMTLTNALAIAGGWSFGTPFGADIHRVLVIRGPLECPCAFEVDLTMILSGEARDVMLQPCDIVYMHNKKMRFGRLLVRIAIDSFLQSFVTAAAGHYGGVHWFPITEHTDSDVIVE